MASKKFYAVKKGNVSGIFETWEECKTSIDGYSGAEYRGFERLAEAQAYLDSTVISGGTSLDAGKRQEGSQTDQPGPEEIPQEGTLLAYVDGSYDNSLKKYAFGCVFILPDGSIEIAYGNGDNEQSLQHRNVTGEMLGAMYAVKVAMLNGFKRIEIRYDYEGIEKWVTGRWQSKMELTRKYAQAMQEWGKKIEISFTKVAAHTNVYYNELADKMAKTGLREGNGIPKVCRLTPKGKRLPGDGEM